MQMPLTRGCGREQESSVTSDRGPEADAAVPAPLALWKANGCFPVRRLLQPRAVPVGDLALEEHTPLPASSIETRLLASDSLCSPSSCSDVSSSLSVFLPASAPIHI